ncbi:MULTISPECIES: iron chelate uptake ABC transporter family permease subunit [Niallia]|uniref:Iron ABC transporter permease n=1 Tax=Niallia circulans TaxID=1397 RepID=A0A0J1I9P1_NIACI|nr:iron chelate uptake ABC transporter family permease subunit [Niallia circulans]KLV22693.1 iron ABC transporter permease [Niallia circulans]MDR4318316.1 iron chelate uptake ABC transporter family permease subunit [Niallia circulans]MED3840448.1 iron chelate uptake ABC transporter family permease subunit [Niallia circulans]MED4243217.1 iron chelate uptake ABC transporter family permease subunit [Niallia circulans]MED4250060.1 iron chelate uptake ABC transporter family permease subunit [Nialli
MQPRVKLIILAIVAALLISIFMLIKVSGNNWEYVIPRRAIKIIAILLTGGCIAFTSMVFQTITNNRILTPSILGLDSLYLFIQTVVVFVFGSSTMTVMNSNINFLLSVVLMVFFSSILYKLFFRRDNQNILLLLLIGIVLGSFFSSLSSFMQVLIDPNEFLIIQDKMFASFNNVNTNILIISIIIVTIVSVYVTRYSKFFDVMSLGRDQAINLGIDYEKVVRRMLIVVSILVSVSTALVGPITFLGLLVVNLAREFLKTYKHRTLITGSILLSIISLVGGLLIVERVFTFSTTISVIINFVGGVYFIYLLLKERKAW